MGQQPAIVGARMRGTGMTEQRSVESPFLSVRF